MTNIFNEKVEFVFIFLIILFDQPVSLAKNTFKLLCFAGIGYNGYTDKVSNPFNNVLLYKFTILLIT